LINRYFIPTVRQAFKENDGALLRGKELMGQLGAGIPYAAVSMTHMTNAIKPLITGVGPFAGGLLTGWTHRAKELYEVEKDDFTHFKGTYLDFDACMLSCYDMFLFAYRMAGFTKIRAIRIIQKWVRGGMKHARHKALEQWEIEENKEIAADEAAAAAQDAAPAAAEAAAPAVVDEASPAETAPVEEDASDETAASAEEGVTLSAAEVGDLAAAEGLPPAEQAAEAVQPPASPRLVQELEAARALDAEINN
jgi:hypothetical protein